MQIPDRNCHRIAIHLLGKSIMTIDGIIDIKIAIIRLPSIQSACIYLYNPKFLSDQRLEIHSVSFTWHWEKPIIATLQPPNKWIQMMYCKVHFMATLHLTWTCRGHAESPPRAPRKQQPPSPWRESWSSRLQVGGSEKSLFSTGGFFVATKRYVLGGWFDGSPLFAYC